MVVTAHIAATVEIGLSNSLRCASVHPYIIHSSLGASECVPKQHLDRFIRFCRADVVASRRDIRSNDPRLTLQCRRCG